MDRVIEKLLVPDTIDWREYEADTEDIARVRRADSWMDQVSALFAGDEESIDGDSLPWGKTHQNIRLRSGELSIWAGTNGSGKSMMLGQVVSYLMTHNRKALIASFEMQPRRTIYRMLRQASQGVKPDNKFQIDWQKWAGDRLWIYDHMGSIQTKRIYAVCRYAADIGCKHVVVDSLMKVVGNEDDYNAQKALLDRLTGMAREFDIHIHIVHHMRKQGDDSKMGGKADIKGSGNITDQADNVFIVWSNREKKEKRESGEPFDAQEPDAVLHVAKQRNGEWEGKVSLWLDPRSLQYLAVYNGQKIELGPA